MNIYHKSGEFLIKIKVFSIFILFSLLIFVSINYRTEIEHHSSNESLVDLTEQSFFNKIKFYNVRPNNYLSIKSQELLVSGNGNELLFVKPKGFIQNSQKLNFGANSGTFIKERDYLHLINKAFIKMKKTKINAKEIDFFSKKNIVIGRKKVKFKSNDKSFDGSLLISSNFLKFNINSEKLLLTGKVKGKLKRSRQYQEGIAFAAQKLSYNGKIGIVKLNKKVKLERSNWIATAQKGKIFLENHSKKLKYYQLSDDVRLTEKLNVSDHGKAFERKAYSERLIGYVLEQKIILFGEPKIYQRGDLIKGTKITLREDKQLIEVENSNSDFSMKK